MLTTRTFCLAVGILLLASCGSERDMGVTTLHIPQGMKRIEIPVAPIFVAPGDHVDVVMIQKGQEIVVLQNVEVLLYDRRDNPRDEELESLLAASGSSLVIDAVDLAVTEEDRIRFVQEVMQRPPGLDLFRPFRLRKL